MCFLGVHGQFPSPETLGRMVTSVRRSDFWNRLGGRALVVIGGWWYSRQPLTNHTYRFSTQTIREIVAPKACTHSFIVSRVGNRPFYRYGGRIELIQFKEYYRMPRGHEHISFVFSGDFRDIFSQSFLRIRLKWEKRSLCRVWM